MNQQATHRQAYSAYVMLVLAALFWAGNFVFGSKLASLIPPIELNLLRTLIGTTILFVVNYKAFYREFGLLRRHWKFMLVHGLLFSAYATMIYQALQTTSIIHVGIIVAMQPAIIPLVGRLFFRTQLRGVGKLLGILLSIVGVWIVVSQGNVELLRGFKVNHGDLWAVLSVFIFALYSNLLRFQPREHWQASRALAFKLVDELKTSDDYLLDASKKANLFEVKYHTKKSLVEKLTLTAKACVDRVLLTLTQTQKLL